MKKLLVTLFALSSIAVSAQWDTLVTGTHASFRGICFTSRDSGTVVGVDSAGTSATLLRTTNGGASWSAPAFPSGLGALNSIRFLDAMNGVITGDNGVVLKTSDGGATWSAVTAFTSQDLLSVSYPAAATIFAGGSQGNIFRSNDNGATWDTLLADSNATLPVRDLYFSLATAGWAAGDGGLLASTTDGNTFTLSTQPYFGFFQAHGVAFNGNSGYAVGEDGLAVMTSDAGMTWNTFSVPSIDALNKVRFLSSFTGVICGDSNFVYRTVDGGMSWMTDVVPGGMSSLTDITFGGDTTAYICGSNGRILKSHADITGMHTIAQQPLNVSVFPNPFENELTIRLQLEESATVSYVITDVTARVLVSENAGNVSGEQFFRPDLSQFSAGLYFIRITVGNSSTSLPVIRK